jgi:hypothetical protein
MTRERALALAGQIADITFDRCGGWEYDAEKVADLIMAAVEEPRREPQWDADDQRYHEAEGVLEDETLGDA